MRHPVGERRKIHVLDRSSGCAGVGGYLKWRGSLGESDRDERRIANTSSLPMFPPNELPPEEDAICPDDASRRLALFVRFGEDARLFAFGGASWIVSQQIGRYNVALTLPQSLPHCVRVWESLFLRFFGRQSVLRERRNVSK